MRPQTERSGGRDRRLRGVVVGEWQRSRDRVVAGCDGDAVRPVVVPWREVGQRRHVVGAGDWRSTGASGVFRATGRLGSIKRGGPHRPRSVRDGLRNRRNRSRHACHRSGSRSRTIGRSFSLGFGNSRIDSAKIVGVRKLCMGHVNFASASAIQPRSAPQTGPTLMATTPT